MTDGLPNPKKQIDTVAHRLQLVTREDNLPPTHPPTLSPALRHSATVMRQMSGNNHIFIYRATCCVCDGLGSLALGSSK